MQKLICALLFAALLGGCATPVTMLRNDATGQIARCGGGTGGFTGGGMIGYSFEKDADDRCVRDYETRGFKRTP